MAAATAKELNPDVSIFGPRAARLSRGPDVSQLKQPIKTSLSGTRQVIHALETATGDVKKVLLDEINLMYECKICQSVFRSLANLISHKRTFCKTKYNDVLHIYKDKQGLDAANLETVIIEAEPVECVEAAQEAHDLKCYSPSLELMKTAGILEELESFRRPCVGPATDRLLLPGKTSLGSVVAGLKARLDGAEMDFYSKMHKNFEAPVPKPSMVHLEPMFETRSAFMQSWRYSEGGETMGQTYRAWQQAEADNEKIRVGPGGEVMTSEATLKLVTGPDGNTYSVKVPVDDDVLGSPVKFRPTQEGSNKRYPCPRCNKMFLEVNKVIRHIIGVHEESPVEVKKLHSKIKSAGVITEGKIKSVKINDMNVRPVKPMQIKIQNLTLRRNGKMNLCEQLSADQSSVCPIMKTKISDSSTVEKDDSLNAEMVNKFVEERETKESIESTVPQEVEKKMMEQVNRRKLQCKLCHKKFSRGLLVKNHVADVHLKLERFICQLCNHGCWSEQSCKEHVATMHRVNDIASVIKEQAKSVYFQKYLLCDNTNEESVDNNEVIEVDPKKQRTVENGEPMDVVGSTESIEEPFQDLDSNVGVIMSENNSSNGLPTPETGSGTESDAEILIPKELIPIQRICPDGIDPELAKNKSSNRGRGRSRGGRKSGRSSISSNYSDGSARANGRTNSRKRGRDEASLGSDDEEVILNIPASGKLLKPDVDSVDEDTLPDGLKVTQLKSLDAENNQPDVHSIPQVPPRRASVESGSDKARSRSREARTPSPGSSDSRASTPSPRNTSDLDSPKKPGVKARR